MSLNERIRTVLEKVVGTVPWAGNARGSNSPVALTFSGPIWVVIASAAAAPTSSDDDARDQRDADPAPDPPPHPFP